MSNKRLPLFVEGVLEFANNLYLKLPEGSILIGYATDVITAKGYNYTLTFNEEKELFEAIKIKSNVKKCHSKIDCELTMYDTIKKCTGCPKFY
jgi:hypothetical protein